MSPSTPHPSSLASASEFDRRLGAASERPPASIIGLYRSRRKLNRAQRCFKVSSREFAMHQTFDWIFFGIMVPPMLAAMWSMSRAR